MCDCKDVEMGSYDNQITLPRPKHMYPTGRHWNPDWISFDRCLLDEILSLWHVDIATIECCCGHNKVEGYICVNDENIPDMLALGYQTNHPDQARKDCFRPKSTTG